MPFEDENICYENDGSRLLMREALGDDVQIFSDTSDSGYVCQAATLGVPNARLAD